MRRRHSLREVIREAPHLLAAQEEARKSADGAVSAVEKSSPRRNDTACPFHSFEKSFLLT